jgi:hypothetical protein
MSKQPDPSDIIELKVEDDGDVILVKRSKPPVDPLHYGMDNLKELQTELESYGCESKWIKKAILAVTFSEYNDEVKV